MHRWFAPRSLACLALTAAFLSGCTTPGKPAALPVVSAPARPATAPIVDDGISLYFSPNGGATAAIVAEIARASETVQVQAYQSTSVEIAKALLEVHKRGVKVTAIFDTSQLTDRHGEATFLHNAGIPVFIDNKHRVAHDKLIIVDGKTVIAGSFDLTKASGESSAESLLVIEDHPGLAAAYRQNFDKHRQHAQRYEGLKPAARQASQSETGPAAEDGTVPSAASQASARRVDDPIIHITKSNKRYHKAGCPSLAKVDIPIKLSWAKANGYTPCTGCKPPG